MLKQTVVHWYNANTLTPSPSQLNFLIFVPLFSLLSLAYLEIAPRFLARASHPYAHLALEILNALFYFAGFVALAVFLAKLLFCRGTVCGTARADAVFAAFAWILWSGSAAMLATEFFRGGVKSLKQVRTDEAARNAMKEQRPRGV